jgi:hypothetical protein
LRSSRWDLVSRRRQRGPSAMAADLAGKPTKAELRDLVEFLANLKAK